MEPNGDSGKDFIELMGQRRSFPRLEKPAPDKELLDNIFLSSLRVPDHMHLKPWRFLVIEGDDRNQLGELFVKDCLQKDHDAGKEFCESARKKALRAPLIVVGIAIVVLGPKDFPVMLKKVGSWIGTAKKYINNIQNEVSNIDIEDKNKKKKKEEKKDES